MWLCTYLSVTLDAFRRSCTSKIACRRNYISVISCRNLNSRLPARSSFHLPFVSPSCPNANDISIHFFKALVTNRTKDATTNSSVRLFPGSDRSNSAMLLLAAVGVRHFQDSSMHPYIHSQIHTQLHQIIDTYIQQNGVGWVGHSKKTRNGSFIKESATKYDGVTATPTHMASWCVRLLFV